MVNGSNASKKMNRLQADESGSGGWCYFSRGATIRQKPQQQALLSSRGFCTEWQKSYFYFGFFIPL